MEDRPVHESEVELYIAEFGEQHRALISDALRFLNEREAQWHLTRPIHRRTYLQALIGKQRVAAAPS